MGRYRYILRLCILIVLAMAGFIAVRSFLIPPSFGLHGDYKYNYYRADSLQEQQNLPIVYQGTAMCADCHEMKQNTKVRGGHAAIACETCHGFRQAHSEDTKTRVPKDLSLELCLRCHEYLEGRPDSVPQIRNFTLHIIWAIEHGFMSDQDRSEVKALTRTLKEESEYVQLYPLCIDCHNPHAPGNPQVTIPKILKLFRG
jgi:cytochrome c553